MFRIPLLVALALRFGWRLANVRPDDDDLTAFERTASRIVHWGFYPLLLALMVSGYLISTADGRGVDVFGLFEVPALLPAESGREEWAGEVHYWLAFGGAYLVLLHVAAALKHQFIDRDGTLRRMIG